MASYFYVTIVGWSSKAATLLGDAAQFNLPLAPLSILYLNFSPNMLPAGN